MVQPRKTRPCLTERLLMGRKESNQTNKHKRGQQFFFKFDFMAMKFTLVLLSKIISKIRYSETCILYHITYTPIEALLYQPLRFILTFKSNRSMISFGRKHCKYDMHNNFHASFLSIAFKSFIDGKDYCTKYL